MISNRTFRFHIAVAVLILASVPVNSAPFVWLSFSPDNSNINTVVDIGSVRKSAPGHVLIDTFDIFSPLDRNLVQYYKTTYDFDCENKTFSTPVISMNKLDGKAPLDIAPKGLPSVKQVGSSSLARKFFRFACEGERGVPPSLSVMEADRLLRELPK